MLLSMGVYWTAWGWRFALGLVLSIYIHEMGHVAALQRYGIKATAPMFIPGFGAMVRLNQYPANPAEDARVGLAGPLWGLGAAVFAYAVFLATAIPFWAAIARTGALINLFNLLPIWQLDGGRGYLGPLVRPALDADGRVGRRLVRRRARRCSSSSAAWPRCGPSAAQVRQVPDNGALGQFLFLVVALSALTVVKVPGVAVP